VEAQNKGTKARLAQRIEVKFQDVPLTEILGFLGDELGLETFVQRNDLGAAEISLDTQVTLKFRHVRADTLLDLALRQVSPELGYTIRDGIVIISTKNALSEGQVVRVYNCRDLLSLAEAAPAAGSPETPATPMPGGTGAATKGGPYGRYPAGGPRPAGSGGYGGLGGGGIMVLPATPAEQLQQVIRTTIAPETWDGSGGSGTMEEFTGLIVVNHSEEVHDRLERMLQMLREATAKK